MVLMEARLGPEEFELGGPDSRPLNQPNVIHGRVR
jgi:hypothetical protein